MIDISDEDGIGAGGRNSSVGIEKQLLWIKGRRIRYGLCSRRRTHSDEQILLEIGVLLQACRSNGPRKARLQILVYNQLLVGRRTRCTGLLVSPFRRQRGSLESRFLQSRRRRCRQVRAVQAGHGRFRHHRAFRSRLRLPAVTS